MHEVGKPGYIQYVQIRDLGRGFFHIGTVRSVLYRIWVCPRYGIRGTKASEASVLDTLLGTTYVGVYET